jgi:hypothetical protein
MLVKGWFHGLFIAALAGIFILLAMWTVPVHAQCGDNPPVSACVTCHEKQAPVYENGAWHTIHGRKECCVNCHGGNCSAAEKEQAHEGMVSNPLSDIYLSCHQCHPDDYPERAARFAATLQITPASSATSTPVPIIPVTGGSAPGGSGIVTAPSVPFVTIIAGLAMLAGFILALGWLEKHRTIS